MLSFHFKNTTDTYTFFFYFKQNGNKIMLKINLAGKNCGFIEKRKYLCLQYKSMQRPFLSTAKTTTLNSADHATASSLLQCFDQN